MRADQALEQERRESVAAARFLREDLLNFAREQRFAPGFASAISTYWNDYYTLENADEMSENEALRFFDWYVFDYQHTVEGERLLDAYQQERWEDLSTQQQAVLQQWAEVAPAGAYELTAYEGQTLQLRAFLTGETFEVYEPGGRGNVAVGDLILARILPVHDHLELSGGAAYLPQDEIGDLRSKLDAARAAHAETYPDAADEHFWRLNNHLIIHHALEQAEANGRAPVARLRSR
jgi:hypothetical protein